MAPLNLLIQKWQFTGCKSTRFICNL